MLLGKNHVCSLLMGVLLFGTTVGTLAGCGNKGPGGGTTSSAAAKTVGAIDQEVLFGLPEFKKAEEEVKKENEKLQKEAEAKLPRDGRLNQEHQRMIREVQLKMQQNAAKKMDPLKTRVEAAILKVSREKKLLVVLDKRIVVYGVPDVTEEVKKAFQAEGEVKTGDEIDTSTSPIGYFDQDVVRALKVFQSADMEIFKKRAELAKEFDKKKEGLSPAEMEMLQRDLTMKLEAYREQVMTPLFAQVNDSVKEVAQSKGLSLVLDKQHVMTGGRNMTSEVVETFLKKTGGGPKTPAPAATSTPAGGQ